MAFLAYPRPAALQNKCSWRRRLATRDENAAAVSGGGSRTAATPDDETVVAGSGVPGLFGEAVNELMYPAS
jgi:hypothetical protein